MSSLLRPPTLPPMATGSDTGPAADHKMAMNDSDEHIVSSVPVYLNHSLAHQLYLIQYPLRPSSRPYHHDGAGSEPEVKLKPNQHRLALTFPIDTTNATSEQYDANHGYPVEQLQLQTSVVVQAATLAQTLPPNNAAATPGHKPAAVTPANTSSTSSNYTLALYSPSHQSLHLTPISTVLRAVPNMAYVEDYSKEAIEERERKLDREFIVDDTGGNTDEETADGTTVKSETPDEEKAEDGDKLKPLLMRFRKRETERSAAMRQRSYAYLQQQDLKEDWLTLKYQSSSSEAAEMAKADGLITVPADSTQQRLAMPVMHSAESYLNHMLYGTSTPPAAVATTSNPPTTPKQASNSADDPLLRRLLPILRSSHVLSTRQLCRVLQLYSPQDLQPYLPLLQQHAHFTHGNWIVRSSTIGTNVQSSRLALCRNYLIARLAVVGSVNKSEMAQKLKLPIDDYNALFNELCIRQLASPSDTRGKPLSSGANASRDTRYILKLPRDDAVASSLPDITDKHMNELQQMLQATTMQLESTSQAAVNAVLQRDSVPATPSHGKQSTPTSQQKSPAPAIGAKTNAASQQQTINQAKVFVSGLLREHGICNRQFIEQQLQKHKQQAQRQASPQRGTQAPDAGSYLQFLTTELLTQVLQSSCYCLTPTLFAMQSTNNEQTDRYRHIIGSLLVKKGKVKKAEVEHAIAQHSNGDTLDYRTYATLMKEFAVFDKSGSEWKLKAGTG